MKKKGRPKVQDKVGLVTFTAKGSEIEKAKRKAGKEGGTLPAIMKKFFQQYISK